MMLVATRTFAVAYDGRRELIKAGQTRVVADHELARRYPDSWTSTPDRIVSSESSSARGGEQAGTIAKPKTHYLYGVSDAPSSHSTRPVRVRMGTSPSRVWVKLASRARRLIVDEARRSRDGLETGGPLFSESRWYSDPFYVVAAGGLGAGAKRGVDRFGMDHVQAMTGADEFRRHDSRVSEAGHWHTHPADRSTRPSDADLRAWAQLGEHLDRTTFLGIIATDPGLSDRAWSRPHLTAWMLRTGPLGSWTCEQAELAA
jgi:Prokaryotic homologs of the JAB domain